MRLSLYRIKRALLAPRTAYLRRRERRPLDQFERAMLELHSYSPAMARMRRDMEAKPDLLYDFPLAPGDLVVDVGAYRGEWSEAMAARHGCRILAFEPDPTSFPLLVQRLEGRPEIVLYDHGLGGSDVTAELALAGFGSSIFPVEESFGTRHVQIRDVARVLEELRLARVDLLKINIEGGEYDLLERLAETGWLSRMRLVMVQFHEWHPSAYRRRWAIRRELRRTHREVWCYPWIWELWEWRAAPAAGSITPRASA